MSCPHCLQHLFTLQGVLTRVQSGQAGERGRCGATQEAFPAHLTCSESPSFKLRCSATGRHRSPESKLRTSLMPCWLGSPWVSPGQHPGTSEALRGEEKWEIPRIFRAPAHQGKAEAGFPECCEPQTGHPDSLPYAEIPAPSTIYTTERRTAAEASHAPCSHDRNPHTELSLPSLAIVPSPLLFGGEIARGGDPWEGGSAQDPARARVKHSSALFQSLGSQRARGK